MKILDYKTKMTENSGERGGGENVIIYGAGVWGKIVCETLEAWNIVPVYFVDRFKQGKYLGIEVISKEELKKYLSYDVLIAAPSAYDEICAILEGLGFQKAYHVIGILKEARIKTFQNLQDKLPADKLADIYSFYMQRSSGCNQKLMIPQISFSVTEACTLKCEKCNALMPFYKRPQTFQFEQYLPAMKRMLETVDEIMEVAFIGGEAFLNKELYKYLDWAIQSEKIISILMVTNATIMPDKKTIESLKNDKCVLCLDNYGSVSKKLKELEEMAIREKITYYILNNEYWYDFGGINHKNYTYEERKKVFENCPMRDCNFFIKGRLYRCQPGGNLVNLGFCEENPKDYVDFNYDSSIETLRKEVMQLISGKEPLAACDFCNDLECSGTIPVAVQMKAGGSYEQRI